MDLLSFIIDAAVGLRRGLNPALTQFNRSRWNGLAFRTGHGLPVTLASVALGKLPVGVMNFTAEPSTNHLFIWNIAAARHGNAPAPVARSLNFQISQLAFRPCGNVIAAGAIDGELLVRRASKVEESTGSAILDGAITRLGWSGNGKQPAVAVRSGQVYAAKVCR